MRRKPHVRGAEGNECAVRDAESADRVIAKVAARQRGVVSRTQLLAAGIDGSAIDRRVRAGRLHVIHRGIYLVGHRVMAAGAREMAALLACGRGAVVSHLSAANLLQLLPSPAKPRPVEITLPGRQIVRRPGIRVHRVKALGEQDVRAVGGIPVTSPARTLLDLAAVLSPNLLERALAESQVRGLVTRGALFDQLKRHPGRSGVRALRRAVEIPGDPGATRSEAERRLLRLVRAAELPAPRVNAQLRGHEVDFLWTEQQLVAEVDGYAYHANRRAFERDRERDARLVAAGYTVLRVTWRQIVSEPEAVVARLATSLAMRATDGGEPSVARSERRHLSTPGE